MQPIVVTVGPLSAASANNISLSQTPNAGTLLLNGSTATSGFQGTASITGNVMTVTATTSGAVGVGQTLSGQGVAANTVVTAVGQTAGTWIVSPAQTVGSETIYGNAVAALDKPRYVLITTTGDEHTKTFTVNGTDWAGFPISETITGIASGTAASSVFNYATVTQITISANAAGAITVGTVGTGGAAFSPWVRLDGFALPAVAKTCVVTGTVNYTVQTSMDDPNAPSNSVAPSLMTWTSDPDVGFQAATTTQQGWWQFVPVWARVLLNSGSGSVTTTFLQAGNAPY